MSMKILCRSAKWRKERSDGGRGYLPEGSAVSETVICEGDDHPCQKI